MNKLFFTVSLGISLSAMGCSNNSEQAPVSEKIVETIAIEQQVEMINEDVDVEKFEKLITNNGGQILDVRTPEEWQLGTIKGAIKMNFYDKDFKDQLSKLDKEKPVYVYCKSGGRSGKAAQKMTKMGFKQVYNLVGGITAWNAAGKEIVKE